MKLILPVAVFVTIIFCPRLALACSCFGTTSPCGAYLMAEAVFVGTVTSVKQQPMKLEGEDLNVQVAVVQVDEAFKGVKAPELIFHSYEISCDMVYKEGQRWLFYATYDKKGKSWYVAGCGRTRNAEYAANDLLYLRALPGAAEKTRIAGALWNQGDHKPLMGVKVKLIGERETHEVFTDKNGVYEMYGLAPGQYVVKPEIPLNLKLRSAFGATIVDLRDQTRRRVDLNEKSCAGVDFYFAENTAVKGTVFGVDGLPMRSVCVSLHAKDQPTETRHPFGCTDENGRFKIEDIGLGQYYLIANDDNVIDSDEPFPLTYYPGVLDKEKATVLTILTGDKLQDFDIHISSQRSTRTIQGRLLFSDGRPAAEESVEFASEEKPGQDQDRVFAKTDAEGHFKLSVLEGSKGTVHGSLYAISRDRANCPQIDKLIKAYKEIETKSITLELNRDHFNLELVLPVPYCAKLKEPEE
ncbi:MAG TPA: hypothetical protein VJP89_19775 [Pyrinomonadaceae bacterium]|nr:hypothetical protein [Pyrinomonadaceae bacterium]